MARWIASIYRLATADCGISPDEFRRMTPRELQWRVDAFFHRRNQEMERLAQVACWVTAPHVSKPMKVSDLVKRQMPKQTDWDEWMKD